jgi:homocysteine S-methyltransferase
MPRFRTDLPQLAGGLYLTDGGLETTLYFEEGWDLPEFAALVLLAEQKGRDTLRAYYRRYADVAVAQGTGFVLESATWRGSRDWGAKIGYSPEQITAANLQGIALLEEIRTEYAAKLPRTPISACMGSRGDGYAPKQVMSANEAASYHREQIATFAGTEADVVTAFTIPYADEAIGIARAARAEAMPVAIGFTVETDGRLPSGETLAAAIEKVDAATDGYPVYYMVNCAHPTHFLDALDGGDWTGRIGAVRANASAKSHAELDESTELDAGNPDDLAASYVELKEKLPNLCVVGGCCGTDHGHVAKIGAALASEAPAGEV